MGQMWSHASAGVPVAPLGLQDLIFVVILFY